MKPLSFFSKTLLAFPSIVAIALMCAAYLGCQNQASFSAPSQGTVEFIQVQQPDFFETTDTVLAEGEKWFRKGLRCVAKGDTAQAKACYQKALLNGCPVSREHLMPVGL